MLVEERDELDRILNQALSTYPAEPMLGIEARILRRVRNEGQASKRAGWTFSFWGRALGASLALALVAAGVFLSRNGLIEKPVKPNGVNATAVQAAPPIGVTRRTQEVEGTIRVKVLRSALPKLDVFPTPSPLTPLELALVKMARAIPSETARRPEKADTAQLEPIQIQVLEIKPLGVEGDEDGDK